MLACEHKKKFSNSVLLSNPPRVSWKCNKCGESGFELFKAKTEKMIVQAT